MRRHAKAPSAGSSTRQASRLGRVFRGAPAARVSGDDNGSGAPSRATGGLLVLAAALLALLVAVATASASKEVVNYFGSGPGGLGGEFKEPRDIAVNTTGNGPANSGDIYVADEQNNRVERFDSQGNFVSAWGADVVQTGGSGDLGDATAKKFEVCTVASQCKAGVATGGNGETSGDGALNQPQSVAVDSDTGHVYVSDRDNLRIDEYEGDGTFVRSFGFDVDATEAGSGYEVCPAANVCEVGLAGSGAGQVGSTSTAGTLGLAVSPADGNAASGTLFLADTQNRRVSTYNLDGSSPGSFGSASDFDPAQPRKIAVDSRGIVYASDSRVGSQIERYDTQDANGGGVGFLAPILASVNERQTVTLTNVPYHSYFTLTCPDGSTMAELFVEFGGGADAANRQRLEESCGSKFAVGDGGSFESGPLFVTFEGKYAETDVPKMTCAPLEGGTCEVTAETNGQVGVLPTSGDNEFVKPHTNAGLAVDPDSDGGGPDKDVLYVLRASTATGELKSLIYQLGPNHQPGLAAAPTAVDDTHGAGGGFEEGTNGLGVDPSGGRLFVSSAAFSAHRVHVLADLASIPKPVVTVGPITVKTDTTATFPGTVDPTGNLVTCKFQYSTDQLTWTDVPAPGCNSLNTDGGPQAVTQNVSGLDPNTRYFVRLVVSRPYFPNSAITSSLRPFETDADPPFISDVGAITASLPGTSARLVATIDPRNSPTGYVFEYGTTPALGSSTPPVDIGGGTEPIVVSQLVTGLAKDTTYYFRVVATNLIGTTTSPGHTFHTRATLPPPLDNRAWEQVSPVDKNYGDANAGFGFFRGGASPDGNAVGYCPSALFGEPPVQMTSLCAPQISRRSAEGWRTPNSFPPVCKSDPFSGAEGGQGAFLSPDYSRVVLLRSESAGCPIPPLDPAAPLIDGGVSDNLYLEDPSVDPPSFQLLNPQVAQGSVEGGSPDFGHVVYKTRFNQTAPPDSPASGDGSLEKLYDWERQGHGDCLQPGGCLTLLSKEPGTDEPFTTPSSMPAISSSVTGDETTLTSAVAAGGERIFFENSLAGTAIGGGTSDCFKAGCQLFMREGGSVTYDVSASECTVDCGSPQSKADYFLSATPSGEDAFFTSCAKLTEDSSPEGQGCVGFGNPNPWTGAGGAGGTKLYRWDRNGAPGSRLVDLTADHEPNDGVQPDFYGLVGQSADGNTAYFVTGGQIVAGAPTFTFSRNSFEATGAKLYRWQWNGGDPSVDYLGPYANTQELGLWDANVWQDIHHVTPDGKYLMIFSQLRLDPAADSDSDADIYRWDEEEGWTCASCQLPDIPSAGDVEMLALRLRIGVFSRPDLSSNAPRTYMSEDGQRIFFGTPDALVPADVNGEVECPHRTFGHPAFGEVDFYACTDIYEWHDGTINLLSSGTGREAAMLIGAGSSGRDVFFYTHDRLVGWDTDTNTDIYDARLGGGFPEPPAQPAQCEGAELCHGPPTVVPPAGGAGTAVFQGAGNPPAKHRKARKHRKRHHKHKRAAKHNRRAGR